jgi:hypothetical protein
MHVFCWCYRNYIWTWQEKVNFFTKKVNYENRYIVMILRSCENFTNYKKNYILFQNSQKKLIFPQKGKLKEIFERYSD